jgi:hypothetical protein
MILRLYAPLGPWLDRTWRPGEIELQPSDEAAEAGAPAAEAAEEEAVLADEVKGMEEAEKAKAAGERGQKAFMDSKK